MRGESSPRTAALIALGAMAVHQLRYRLADGSRTGQVLAEQGHAYLTGALPILAAFVLSALAASLLPALAGRIPGSPASFRARAIGFALSLFCVFAAQESLEGLFSAGHPSGIAAVLSGGGWLAVPLAILVGCMCALAERRLVGLERRVASAARKRRSSRHAPPRSSRKPRAVFLHPSASPLAFGIASRPPPALPLAG